jgi:hypothetical protein
MRFVKRVGEEEKRSEQGPKPWNSCYVHNLIKYTRPEKAHHEWAQSSAEAEHIIKNVT